MKRRSIQRDEISEFLNCCGRIGRSRLLVIRLKEDVQIHTGFVAFIFLKYSRNDRARKTGLSSTKVKVLVGSPLLFGLFEEHYR